MTTHERRIGVVSHWFSHLNVAAIELTAGELHVGDQIHVHGHTTDVTQPVRSLQIDHHAVGTAHVGDSVGVRLSEHAREHDVVYLVTED